MAGSDQSLVSFLCERQAALGLTNEEITRLSGFESTRAWPLIKAGRAKLAVQSIAGISRALQVDPSDLLERAMNEYMPEVLCVINETWGLRGLSAGERQVVEHMRASVRTGNRVISVIINGEPLALRKE